MSKSKKSVPAFPDAKGSDYQKKNMLKLLRAPIPKGEKDCLNGITFTVTGPLPALTKSQAKQLIEKYGGNYQSSINGKTDVIIQGIEDVNAKKMQEAVKRGIPITDQHGLFKFISKSINDKFYDNSEIQHYIEEKKNLQIKIIEYLDNSDDIEERYQNLYQLIQKIRESKHDLKDMLYLLARITNNHIHSDNFYNKIDAILNMIKTEISEFFSNFTIFKIFKDNKRVLLYLIEEKILRFDIDIYNEIIKNDKKLVSSRYPEYFSPEILPFLAHKLKKAPDDTDILKYYRKIVKLSKSENFNEKRKAGENDGYIYDIIRKDLIEEFIIQVERNNVTLKGKVKRSIFETHLFLNKLCGVTLIEYAAFFGSIQIFKYLYKNGVELTPSLWLFAVHSNNQEIINLLEENKVELAEIDTEETGKSIFNNRILYNRRFALSLAIDTDEDEIDKEDEEIINIDENDGDENDENDENDDDDDISFNETEVSFKDCIKIAIECHNNDVFFYFQQNINHENDGTDEDELNDCITYYSFHYHNYFLMPKQINLYAFCLACKFDYYTIVKNLLSSVKIYINDGENDNFNEASNPLLCAAKNDNEEIINLLFSQGIKMNKYTFNSCKKLKKITIPSDITKFEDYVFCGCESLKQITIPSSVTSIGKSAFRGCSSLTQITIPSSVTSIGYSAFCGCSSLTQITIPSSVTSIGVSAFDGCSSLTQITIPSSVTSIGISAFRECSSLTQITIPSSVTSIGVSAFRECSSLTQITIPSSVTSIGVSAFYECSSLTQITIPSSVTSIGEFVFLGCSSLAQVTIPSSVTSIGKSAFRGCSSLTQITIPPSVTSIGECALSECSSLTQITIPSSVTSIGKFVFEGCSSLTQITIPSSVTEIGNSAFKGCSSLTQITIPSSVTKIGNSAFKGCSSLKQAIIPSSLTIDQKKVGIGKKVKIIKS